MKVKALINFAGIVSMSKGEEMDIKKEIAEDLIRAEFVEKVKAPKPKKQVKK